MNYVPRAYEACALRYNSGYYVALVRLVGHVALFKVNVIEMVESSSV